MQAGIPALILLAATSCSGLAIGVLATGGKTMSHAASRILIHSVATATVAVCFWLWAVQKVVMQGDPDMGALTFALVLASTYNGSQHAMHGKGLFSSSVRTQKLLHGCASTAIVLNYALVVWSPLGLPGTFKLYLVLGALYWLAAGLLGHHQLCSLEDSLLPF